MEIVQRNIGELISAEYNPRQMTLPQRNSLTDSIKRFGLVDPILVNVHTDRKNIIIGGHQRVTIAKELGIETVPTVELELDAEKERELNVRLNRNTGEWDWDGLANNFDVDELINWGFELDELKIDDVLTDGLTDEDSVPEVEDAITKAGDLWLLGDHRLLCGDATKKEDVERLMDGSKADMVFTDPPYGMSYGGGRAKGDHALGNKGGVLIKAHGMIIGDDKTGDDLIELVGGAVLSADTASKEGASKYVCFSWRSYSEFEQAILNCGLSISACIVWDKKSIGLGKANYRPQHEFIFYCKGDSWQGDMAQSDVWYMSRGATTDYVHPTQKPVELIGKAVTNSSKSGDVIIDVFLGSGSTLIACEKTNRKCYGLEIDPHYCDVIVKRWEEYTGNKAELFLPEDKKQLHPI
tara:strand:- start:640 stop:1869 length:1230 start_codon:yes stop_codon:yes gene_type:complete